MKNNKLICIVLALLVCLSIAVSVSATEATETTETVTGLTFSLVPNMGTSEGPTNIAKPGETFTVIVNLDSNPGIKYLRATINYNAEAMELVSAKSLNESVQVSGNKFLIGNIAAAIQPTNYDTYTVTGAVVELTFKVVETKVDLVENEISLNVSARDVVDVNGKANEIAVDAGEKFNVYVPSESHVCDMDNLLAVGAVEATCSAEGKEADMVCPVCGAVKVEGKKLEKTEHTIVVDEAVEATCTDTGLTAGEHCAICDYKVAQEETPALGHNYERQYVINDATCEAAGTEYVKCSVCNKETVREIAIKEHNPVDVAKKDATCVEAGHEAGKVCSMCGKTMEGMTEIVATGVHTYGEWYVTVPSTCGAFGTQVRTCTVCGATETDDKVPATGAHIYDEWKVTTAATTEAEGVETRECSVCGASETRSIEKLPEAENNTVLVVVIVAVVVLAGAGVAAYFVLKNKKK